VFGISLGLYRPSLARWFCRRMPRNWLRQVARRHTPLPTFGRALCARPVHRLAITPCSCRSAVFTAWDLVLLGNARSITAPAPVCRPAGLPQSLLSSAPGGRKVATPRRRRVGAPTSRRQNQQRKRRTCAPRRRRSRRRDLGPGGGRDVAPALLAGPADRRGWPLTRDLPYWLVMLGDPTNTDPWAWRINGHHLLAQATVVGDQVNGVPHFFGAEPATVLEGPHAGLRALPREEDLARELMLALQDDQRRMARIAVKAPADIASRWDPVAALPEQPRGVPYAQLDRSTSMRTRRARPSVASSR
jgi:Protein of unknown function (DUF3500)